MILALVTNTASNVVETVKPYASVKSSFSFIHFIVVIVVGTLVNSILSSELNFNQAWFL